jgi:pyruvate-formate lyase-activating enzyme
VDEPGGEPRSRTWVQAIDRAWRQDAKGVFFGAPDFERRRDFGSLVAHAVGRGLDTGWLSDGVALVEPEYAQRLVERARLRSIHLRGAPSDLEVIQEARGVLQSSGVEVTVTVEVSDLDGASIAELSERAPDATWSWHPRGEIHGDPSTTFEALAAAAAQAGHCVVGLPSCVAAIDELQARCFAEVLAAEPADPTGDDANGRVLPPICAGCSLDMDCAGVPASWARAHGGDGLRPVFPTSSARPWSPIPAGELSAFRPTERPRLDVAPRYPDTALITLMVPGCDLSCIFCDTPQEGMAIQFSTRSSVRASLLAMSGRSRSVLFTGGEPSRLSWLTDIFEDARALGYERIQMQSHAGAAADPAVADAWIAAGLDAIDVPIYGADAETHEAVTRTPGSFERTHAGLANLRERGAASVIHTTLFESNVAELEAIVRHIDDLAPSAAYLQITGEVGAPGTYAQVAPSPERVGSAMVAAFSAVTPETPFQLSDVAPCLVPGLEDLVASWKAAPSSRPYPVILPYSEWLMVFSGGRTKGYGDACDRCSLYSSCDGLPREAIDRFLGVGLVPR